ncbi:hypothetical protein PRIPAC_78553 [Pristionchus pacificus]|uniref:ABC transporter domain-containing protein n=1 Tax=Pristionchus pacificus TaxID=54126 RepID=A0A2A6C3K0_PRIPA|nr:hypothetical protein PRIPAC_78553 [Pristionchus pacificus]|eukprot:PDM72812.1 hypothetical protein PRIPAC_39246 [Pristionchus pacificus]
MFRKMEMFGSYFGVQSYGMSLNRLEQVFLKVGEMTGTIDRTEEVEAALKELIQENDKRVRGSMKTIKQFGIILLKRLHFDKRNDVYLSTLAAIAAMVNNPSLTSVKFGLTYLLFLGFLSGELIILINYRFFSSRAKGENLMLMIFSIIGISSVGNAVNPLLLLYPMNAASAWKVGLDDDQNKENVFNQKPELGKITGPLFIAIHFIALVFIFILLERRVFSKKSKQTTANTVTMSTYQMSDSMVLRVVKGISFGVRSHECFGVLGVNGAGKTTTFEVLTGNSFPDEGSATVGGVDCSTPATDALIEDLSGRESLIILAALHGYENPRKVADIVITCVGMKEHANRPSKRYRDEVEALVSNLIIMKEGLIVVEGTTQLIKNQFGEHYNFNLTIENVSHVGMATLEDAFMLAASAKPDVQTAVAAVSSSVRRIRSESAKEETEGTEGKTTGTDGRGTEGTEGGTEGGIEGGGRETDWIDGGTEGIDGSSSAKAHEA